METMTEHAPAVQPPTAEELAAAAGPSGHGIASITVTVHGEVMVVCVCSQVGYGATEEAARTELAGHTG